MVFISYNIGCRNCLKSDGVQHSYSIIDGNQAEYQSKTEFEIVEMVEKMRKEDNHSCQFCGSSNVEILETKINNLSSYDYNKLTQRCLTRGEYMLMINIDKREGQLNMKPGGSEQLDRDFLCPAIDSIIDTVKSRPDDHFISRPNGNFLICVIGGNHLSDGVAIWTERFRSSGLTKEEILSVIFPIAEQLGMSFTK